MQSNGLPGQSLLKPQGTPSSPVIMSPDNSFTSPSTKMSMSSLRNIRKDMRKQNVSITKVEPATTPVKLELSGPVRKPTLKEKNEFFKQITFDPKCPICAEVVWNETHKDTLMKQKLFARHAFKKHLMEEMKVCPSFLDFFISLIQVNLFQKPSFLHQLTNNMTRDCSLNSPKNTCSQYVVYKNCFCFVLTIKTIFVHYMF